MSQSPAPSTPDIRATTDAGTERPQAGSEPAAAAGPDVAWWRRPAMLLALVAAVHAVLPILVLGRHWFIGIDESVYLSQINAHVPPGGFSAPRARGSTFLAAPVTAFTDAVAPMRVWTTVLSGLGLFLAFRTWLRLRPGYLVPVAAAMFASLWVVTYYGFQVMPNEWVAFATVGACGSLMSFLLDGRRLSLAGAALALGVAALFRPSDAAFALLAFGLICLACRTSWRRRIVAVAALALGAAAGAADWVIEAYTTYGGLRNRLHVAEAEQGGAGLHWSGIAQLKTLGGPVLCRNSCSARAVPLYWAWWAVAAVLIAVAIVHLRRAHRPILLVAPLVLGAITAAQYLFTVPYAAPRFLLPAYAALALPVAAGALVLLQRARPGGLRLAVATVLVLGFAGHTAIQLHALTARLDPPGRTADRQVRASAAVLRAAGVRSNCVVLGMSGLNGPLAYRLRCSNIRPPQAALQADLRRGVQVVWLRDTPPSHLWGYHWTKTRIGYFAPTDAYISTTTPAGRASG